ncbi:MAG: class I SAM-dependent methyltransferase [Dehalococcoidia bacterium]|jgi:SAM-dependent methyltransferase|nr:class I SAM-dependent methyltransferase [Dehalococcoidia bacterium]
MPDWIDDSGFWESVALFFFTEAASEVAVQEVESVVQLLNLSPGARILDVGCGNGRHTLELARRGFPVTGLDNSRSFLDIAVNAAANLNLDAEFVEGDQRRFTRPSEYDAAISISSSWGWFPSSDDNLRVFQNVFSSLKPGGKLLIQIIGKENLSARFQERTWLESDDGSLLLQERRVRDGWGWLDSRWLVVRQGEVAEFSVSHPVYSGSEVEALLRKAGFDTVSLYGDFDGRPYDEEARLLIAVATTAADPD